MREKNRKSQLIYYNLAISILFLILSQIDSIRVSYDIMLLYSVNSFIIFTTLLILEIINFKGLSLNIPLLIGYAFRLTIPSLTKAWGAMHGEEYFFLIESNKINDFMFPTVVWMNIYYSIFYWCLIKFDKQLTIENSIKPLILRFKIPQFTIPLFIIGIIYKIYTSFIPAGLIPSTLSFFLGQLTTLAIIAQMFDTLFSPSKLKKRLFIIFIIISLWETITYGFYKGDIMMNIIYYLLYYFLDCQYNNKRLFTFKLGVFALIIFVFIDVIIYPFMSSKRVLSGWDVTNGGIATKSYSSWDILIDVINGNETIEKDDNSGTSRLDAIPANAFFYKECCTKHLRTTEIATNNIGLLVPRFLNPNKHNSQAGLMVYAYAITGSFKNIDMAVSNNYIGQFASSYLIGGWIVVIILAFINGLFFIFYYNFLLKNNKNIFALLLLVQLILNALYAFEEIHDGGALRIGYNSIMMLGVLVLKKLFPITNIR